MQPVLTNPASPTPVQVFQPEAFPASGIAVTPGRTITSGLRCCVLLLITGHWISINSAVGDEPAQPDPSPPVKFASGNYTGPLPIPRIARYQTLPMRMLLEPEFELPPETRKVDAGLLQLFDRVLKQSEDDEILEQAALGMARLTRESLADTSASGDILQKQLQDTASSAVRLACAIALVAGNHQSSAPHLLSLAAQEGDEFRLAVEPALAMWKYQPAEAIWKQRLTDPFASAISIRLACEGLTALGSTSSFDQFKTLVTGSTASFANRFAASKAMGTLHPEESRDTGKTLAKQSIMDRLLAVQLLTNQTTESVSALIPLCQDTDNGVAAAAWNAVYTVDSSKLIDLLDQGRQHQDAVVRMTSARVMQQFPDAERCEWLNILLSDYHLEVRNTAREQLVSVAEKNSELKPQIIAEAADKLMSDARDWQGIEQSLLVLGQLRSPDYSDRCVPLLDHHRNEVAVSAAWLIHLYPDDKINDVVLQKIATKDDLLGRMPVPPGTPAAESIPLQVAHLMMFAGLQRLSAVQPRLEKSFSKDNPGGIEKRAAALWAIGLIRENSHDQQLTTRLEARVKDRDGMMPEFPMVRQISVRSLGMIGAVSSVPVVLEAYKVDPPETLIPHAARWALPLLSEPQPADIPGTIRYVGGFRLNPATATP